MSYQKPLAEENKLNEVDLEVVACAGKDAGLEQVMKSTRLSEEQVRASLTRAAVILPGYLTSLAAQAQNESLPGTHRQMAAQASQSLSAVIHWIIGLQKPSAGVLHAA